MLLNERGELRVFRLISIGVVALALLLLSMCSFERVESGNVGVRVNQLGSGAGVSPQPLNVGWYFTPPGVNIYEYPIFTNTQAWKGDDRFVFQDKNGMTVSADVSVAYRADPSKAPLLFQKYRTTMDTLLEGPVRQTLRQAVVAEASQLTVDQIYGAQKASLIERARQRANRYLNQFGLVIEQLFWDSNINLPETVQHQIAARVENEQRAIATQAQVATANATANIQKAQAEGYATAKLTRARADAEATKLMGEALRSNPESIEQQAINKWNGSVPQIIGSTSQVPFIGPTISKR
jgi:regulator of protease activity HflC (stomatin/prohibitin superfamily)